MRKILALALSLVLTFSLMTTLSAADAVGKIHHFTLVAPPTAKSGEAIDITVEAKDKDDKIITDYRGSVYFSSDTDFGATIPAQGRAVTFNESDNGSKKLSKAVTFKRTGNQKLTVNEAVEDAEGSITIRVDENTTPTSTGGTETVTITTPEKGSQITGNSVMVSGKTKKNSKVILILNAVEVATLVSDDTGIFTKNLTDITQATNILKVNVLDGNNSIIGSSEVSFGTITAGVLYYGTSVLPALDVEASTGITITVDAEPTLTEVSILLDGSLLVAREQSPGKYIASTTAPIKSGAYPLNVTMKNVLGASMTKSSAVVLNVKEPVVPTSTFRNVKAVGEGSRASFNFFVDNIPADVVKFKIAYGDSADSMSQEASTYEIEKIKQTDGSYSWYVPGLQMKTYAFKIFGMRADGSLSSLVSEVLSVSLGGGSCTIGNVGNVGVSTMSDKTTLSWEALSGAVSYNIYRVTAVKDYELIQNVKENTYTLYLSSGALEYQDFAVKALCDSTTESAVPAIANHVQTGPGALAILVIISAIASIFFVRRRVY